MINKPIISGEEPLTPGQQADVLQKIFSPQGAFNGEEGKVFFIKILPIRGSLNMTA